MCVCAPRFRRRGGACREGVWRESASSSLPGRQIRARSGMGEVCVCEGAFYIAFGKSSLRKGVSAPARGVRVQCVHRDRMTRGLPRPAPGKGRHTPLRAGERLLSRSEVLLFFALSLFTRHPPALPLSLPSLLQLLPPPPPHQQAPRLSQQAGHVRGEPGERAAVEDPVVGAPAEREEVGQCRGGELGRGGAGDEGGANAGK